MRNIARIVIAVLLLFIAQGKAYAVDIRGEVRPTNISIQGHTSPKADVVLENKGHEIRNVIADSSGDFVFILNDIDPTNVSYSIYAKDIKGDNTSVTSIKSNISAHADNDLPEVTLSPTVELNGNSLSGYSHPEDTINILMNNTQIGTASVNPDGHWESTIDTKDLANGTYSITATDTGISTSEASLVISYSYTPPTNSNNGNENRNSNDFFTHTIRPIVNSIVKTSRVIVYAIKQNPTTVEAAGIASSIIYSIPQTTNILNAFYEILIAISETPIQLFRLLVLFLELLGIKKKPDNWGVVFDSLSKQPVDPVVVKLTRIGSDSKDKEQTRITDFEGRFGFLVDPGKYIISISKAGYKFPSEILKGQTVDIDRGHIYYGDELNIQNPELINVNIPIDPLEFNWNQANKPIQYKPQKARIIIKRVSLSLLAAGFLASIYYLVKDFNITNLLLLLLYPLFYALSAIFVKKQRPWGVITNKKDGRVYPLVTIKALKGEHKIIGGSCTSDHLGRYYLILSEGSYILQAEIGEGEEKKTIWESPQFTISKDKSVVNWNVFI